MTQTEIRTETDEWEVEVCENCGHDASFHYDEPKVVGEGEPYEYVAIGCMVLSGKRRIPNNPYPRCECMKCV